LFHSLTVVSKPLAEPGDAMAITSDWFQDMSRTQSLPTS
jgi:hypothetical protein